MMPRRAPTLAAATPAQFGWLQGFQHFFRHHRIEQIATKV
jgi:hypothetical protein